MELNPNLSYDISRPAGTVVCENGNVSFDLQDKSNSYFAVVTQNHEVVALLVGNLFVGSRQFAPRLLEGETLTIYPLILDTSIQPEKDVSPNN